MVVTIVMMMVIIVSYCSGTVHCSGTDDTQIFDDDMIPGR